MNEKQLNMGELPEEVLIVVYDYSDDIQVLLNCRLVCKNWKAAAEAPEAMRQLVFNLPDWPTFLKSEIINKVKSVGIVDPLNGEINDWFKICNKIGKSVETVKFEFSMVKITDENIKRCKRMVKSLIKAAARMQELHLNGADILSLTKPRFPVHKNIKTLVVTGRNVTLTLKKLICSFPNVQRIEITQEVENKDHEPYGNGEISL